MGGRPALPRHPPLPPTPPNPYHALLKPALSPSKGTLEPPGAGGPGRQPDLRVNVAKCRRMSHFFIPPLGECRTLRVKNLTIWAHSRPFRPISVQFRLTCRHCPCPNPSSFSCARFPSFSCPDTGIHAPSRSDRLLRREPRLRHSRAPTRESTPPHGRTAYYGENPAPRHSRAPTRESTPPHGRTAHYARTPNLILVPRHDHAPSRSDRPLRREPRTPVILVPRHGKSTPPRGRTAHYGENPEPPSFSCPDTGIHAPSVGPPTTARTPSPSFPCPDTGIHAPSVPPTTARTPSPSFPCPDTGIAPRPLVRRRCPARQPGVAVLRAPRYARTGPTVRTAEADQRRRLSSWTRSSSRFRGCGTT